jgi:hypothetical protein
MKDILIRSVFGIVFLFVIFVPFSADIQNGSNLFVITLFIFTLLGIHELFEMDKIGGFQSNLKIPAILLSTTFFLPLLIYTAKKFFPGLNLTSISSYIFNEYTLYISLSLSILSILVFSILIFKSENVRFLYKNTFLLAFFYRVFLPFFTQFHISFSLYIFTYLYQAITFNCLTSSLLE